MARITTATSRPLTLDNLRTFVVVSRCLSFSAAAEELHYTQSAISRRIQALEDELGTPLFVRDTRRVELTRAGEVLREAVVPALEQIDRSVARLRSDQGRRHVSVTTFSTLATLWLLPRLTGFQDAHPDIDIRIAASDKFTDLDDPEMDVALRYVVSVPPPSHAEHMFDEVMTPVVSPMLRSLAQAGQAPSMQSVADLKRHTLLDHDEANSAGRYVTWRHWLQARGEVDIEPRRRITINYGHQIIQAAMAGQGIALGRLALIHPLLERGELSEVFGTRARLTVDAAYWMIPMLGAVLRPELQLFLQWLRTEAAATRAAMSR